MWDSWIPFYIINEKVLDKILYYKWLLASSEFDIIGS